MDIAEILGKIGFDARVALFNTINFLLVLILLRKIIFGKVVDIIKHRQETIAKNNENAIKLENELKDAEAKSSQIIAEANRGASEIISKNQEQVSIITAEMKSKAQEEIDAMKDEAQRKIEKQKEKLSSEVKVQAIDLTIAATEALLKEKISDSEDKKKIEKFIESVNLNQS